MNLRTIVGAGVAVLVLGCGKAPQDTSRVIANIGGEKITEKALAEALASAVGDAKKTQDILGSETMRPQRNGFLEQMAMGKAIVAYGKAQGLDKDPAVKAQMERIIASAYFQVLVERQTPKVEPTEADLKAFYEELSKQMGPQIPPFEQIKDRLPQAWKQRREQEGQKALFDKIRQQVGVTISDDYKGGMGM